MVLTILIPLEDNCCVFVSLSPSTYGVIVQALCHCHLHIFHPDVMHIFLQETNMLPK